MDEPRTEWLDTTSLPPAAYQAMILDKLDGRHPSEIDDCELERILAEIAIGLAMADVMDGLTAKHKEGRLL